MYKLPVILVFFTPLILALILIDSKKVEITNKLTRWVLREKKFIGRHPCASDSVCDCWVVDNTLHLLVNCSNRNLTEPPKMYRDMHITKLDLSGNALRWAPNMKLEGYSGVHHLDLSNNLIVNVTDNLITRHLMILDLSKNKISRVENSFLQKLLRRQYLMYDLTGNPWICDCQSTALLEFVKLRDYQPGVSLTECDGIEGLIVGKKYEDICPGKMRVLPVLQVDQKREDEIRATWEIDANASYVS